MEKVKISTDGTIDFKAGESIPTTAKKFRQSPEIEAFYRFIYENDLRMEALEVLTEIADQRKKAKELEKLEKKAAKASSKKAKTAKKTKTTPAKKKKTTKK